MCTFPLITWSVQELRRKSIICGRSGAPSLSFGSHTGYRCGMASQDDQDGLWIPVKLPEVEDLVIAVRLEQQGRRIYPSGVKITKSDRSEITARDLRRASVREAFAMAKELKGLEDPRDVQGVRAKPPRPGPTGHPVEHFRAVLALYNEAREVSPGREIKWMRERWEPPVPDATMRRWRDRALDMRQRGEL